MKSIYFTPGPSQLWPSVSNHINEAIEQGIPSWSHRSEEFRELFRATSDTVKKVMGAPKNTHVFFLGSGTEAMERVVQNTVEKKSFHFVNGSFSRRMCKISSQLGKQSEKLESLLGTPFDFDVAIIPKETELLCFTQNETSMGLKMGMGDIAAVSRKHPHALVSVDVVSSAPCVDLDFDVVDCSFFSVQKCFGLPSGLGVLMVNDDALKKSREMVKNGISIGSYHSFPSMAEDEAKFQTPETPNVLSIYLLGKVCEEFLEYGISNIKKDSKQKAAMLYDFFDSHPMHTPFVQAKHARSDTVIVANAPNGSKQIIAQLKQKGLIIGSGYAEYKDAHMRIANFPAHKQEDIQKVIDALTELG